MAWSRSGQANGQAKGYSKGQAKGSQSWGRWRCQCGNVQSGSQCHGCRKKWWQVQWTPAPTQFGAERTNAWEHPKGAAPKKTDPLTQLKALLGQMGPVFEKNSTRTKAPL